jgi:glycosyltransferase involved in cell wall biosynthesis
LKAFACEQATGDILLELDCDDMLAPTAIEEVKAAFADPSIGFVYSNCIHAMADLTPYPRYDASYGWRYREVEFQGHKLDEFRSFPPTPESVSRVWYGPDHLRAFRRSVYQKIGGHDKALKVLDDSDLVIRMYLETKFAHLDKPLYLYRVHGQNSWLRHNKEIQDGVWPLYDKYIERLVKRWCDVSNLPWVDVNQCEDICKRGTSTVGAFKIIDTLAKIPSPLNVMREIYRVLIPGGWLLCSVPSTDGRGAWQDPRHVSFWNENSFLYYTNRQWARHIDTPVRFQNVRLYTTEKDANQVCWTVAHLLSLKDGYRPPGELHV